MNKNQKLTIMLSMTMALGSVSNTFAAGIKDVDVERVFGKDNKINVLKNKNFVQGFENGDLKLDQGIKRSEITKLLAYANGQEELAKKLEKIQGTYKDVEITYWANGVINAASQNPVETNGLFMIKGYPDGTFMPEKDITYAELAKMLVVLADDKLTEEDVKAADLNWPSEWIAKAKELGIFEDITFAEVNQVVNREDAFTMFYNALEKNKIEIEDKKEESKSVSLLADNNRKSKKRRKSSRSSSNNSNIDKDEDKKPSDDNDKEPEKPVDPTEPEELKKAFLDAAKAQKSLDENIYSLNFDGEKAEVVFKESALKENPVEVVTKAAEAMMEEMLKVADKVDVTIGDKTVTVTKDNKNTAELAHLFLGEMTPEEFIKNGNVEKDFSIKISKGDVKDVAIDKLHASFKMDMDKTNAENALREEFINKAKAQGTLNKDLYSLNFDGEKAEVVFKESALKENPVEVVTKAAEAMMEEMLKVADKVDVTIGDKTVTVTKDNKNTAELAHLFLGEMTPEEFIKNGNVEKDFSIKISKGDVKDVAIDKLHASFKMDMDKTKAEDALKKEFLETAEKQEALNKDLYSLNFDGEKAEVVFKESALKENPVEVVTKAAEAMMDEMLKVADKVDVTIGDKTVTVTKDNKNTAELAHLFLGEMTPEEFIKNGNVEKDFSIKISKGDVRDVAIDKLHASFKMDMDKTNAENALREEFINKAKAQGTLKKDLYSLSFDGTNANVVFKESELEKEPVKVVTEAAEKMMEEMLKVADKVDVTIGDETVIVSKENKNTAELAHLFLGEMTPEEFIKNGNVEKDFSIKISKDDVRDVAIDKLHASFKMDNDVSTKEERDAIIVKENAHIENVVKACNKQANNVAKIDLSYEYDESNRVYTIKVGESEYNKSAATPGTGLATGLIEPMTMCKKETGIKFFTKIVKDVPDNLKSFEIIVNGKSTSLDPRDLTPSNFEKLGFGYSDKMEKLVGNTFEMKHTYTLSDGFEYTTTKTMKIVAKDEN